MRLERAIERFLEQGAVESDWTAETIRSYGSVLYRVADRHPDALVSDFDGRQGHDLIIRDVAALWGRASTGTRGNRISILHSFFEWLEREYLIDSNHVRRIKRPPVRRALRDRPTAAEMELTVRSASIEAFERAPLVAMRGVGLRRRTILASRWRHWNLTDGRVDVWVKGDHWVTLPLDPATLEEMRECFRRLQPDPADFLFPAQRVKFDRPGHSTRTVPDPKQPSSPQALWNMVRRVSKRAVGRELHPHQFRHGFANELDLADVDLRTTQFLMGHSRVETTEGYMDERRLEDAAERLLEAHKRRQDRRRQLRGAEGAPEGQGSGWRGSNPQSVAASVDPQLERNPDLAGEPGAAPDGGHNVEDR